MHPDVRVSEERARGCGYRQLGGTYAVCNGTSVGCCRLPFDLISCPCCSQGIKPSRGWTWLDLGMLLRGPFGVAPCRGDESSAVSLGLAGACPLADPKPGTKVGLLWVGGKFYRTPADFQAEAKRMGVSRRIPAVPKDFVLGETWVLLAHRAGRTEPCTKCAPLRKDWAKIVSDKAARDVQNMSSDADPALGTDGEEAALADLQAKMEACEPCKGRGSIEIATVFSAFKPTAIERIVDENVTDEEVMALKKRGIDAVIVKPIIESQAQLNFEGSEEED